MIAKQKTVKSPVFLKGTGLHTGLTVEMTILPAPENHGVAFKRVDLDNQPKIRAIAENVVDTSRGTTIQENGARVSTIEHLMASLVGLGIDNAIVEINAPEVPILDGSAKIIVETIKKTGIVEQSADKKVYTIREKMIYKDEKNGIEIIALPDEHFSMSVMIDYHSHVLGFQYSYYTKDNHFDTEIAPARTFVFLHELELLLKNNLIKGGDLDNAIVLVERTPNQDELDRLADLFNKPHVQVKNYGILNNTELRFSNEPARHKLLDMIGDLALIGQGIKGRIIATRPGHFANNQFAKLVRNMIKEEIGKPVPPEYDPNEAPLMDIQGIQKMLPHRNPFLLVDRIIRMDESTVVGLKNVTMNEPFFVGHFPHEAVMPGVLLIEATAQVGGIFTLNTVPDPENYTTYFMKIDKVRFKKKVVPGDTLIFSLRLLQPIKRGICLMEGKVFVAKDLVMEGEFMAQIVKYK